MTACLALRHVAFEDAGILAPLLARRGIDLAYVEAGGDAPDSGAWLAADLVVVLGGPIGVYDTTDYPFLTDEIAMLRARLAARRPTLGICLGAQLIAAALDARVAPGPAKEIGYAPLDLTAEGRASVLAPLDGVAVLHWHGDNLDLPGGATRLASTSVCPTQAFAVGRHALGLQFHIETEPRALERWLIGHAAELSQARIAPASLRAQAATHGAATAAAGRRVLDAWLADALS
ncbi:MAG: glutamine amidotransferase [Xanthobacteraceae bacterium]|nr:MAG: glutamine amidotransferase [Xanthobacteraceae bacterium]